MRCENLVLTTTLTTFLLTGCATDHLATQSQTEKFDAVKEHAKQFPKAADSSNLRVVEFRDEIYLPRKSIPLAIERALPAVFSKPDEYKINFVGSEGRVNLSSLAERITKTTGIAVEINPNVYVRNASVGGQANLAFDQERPIPVDYVGPLARYLDLVCSRIGISWEYANGRLHFYRWKSKTWEIKAMAGKQTMNSGFSSSGSVSGGGKEGSSSGVTSVSQKFDASIDIWASITDQLKKILGAGAEERMSINQAVGTVTVTGSPQNISEIDRFIEEHNRRTSRQVFIKVEFYTLSERDDKEAGLDISGILTGGNGRFRYFSNPITSVATAVGGLTGVVLPSEMAGDFVPSPGQPGFIGDGVSRTMNTQALFKAINQVATVSDRQEFSVWTINNQPAPLTLATSQDYVRSIGTTSSNTSTQSTVEQATITTGTFLTLLPRIFDNNSMMMQFNLDLSTLSRFETTLVGNTSVKSPTVPHKATSNTVKMKAGETLVLSQIVSDSENGQGAAGILGASKSRNKNRETMLILITPTLKEGD